MISNKEKEEFFKNLILTGKLVISPTGEVTNTLTRRNIGYLNGGYKRISYMDSETRIVYKMIVSRLMWIAFVGNIPQGLVINHKNGVKIDDRISNYELVTPRENWEHAKRSGLASTPEESSSSIRASKKWIENLRRRKLRQLEREANKLRSSPRPDAFGPGNSQFGTFWITDGFANEKWSPAKGDIPEMFRKGRTL